jgi:hypothetical protein
VLASTRAVVAGGDDASIRSALAVTWAARHLENLRLLEARLHDSAGALERRAPEPAVVPATPAAAGALP